MKKKYFFYFSLSLFLSFALQLKAKNDSLKKAKNAIDTNYIASYKQLLQLTFIGNNKTQRLKVNNKLDVSSPLLVYETNNKFNWGFALDYKWLSIELTKKSPFNKDSQQKKGKTDQTSLSFGVTGKKIWFTSRIENHHGFYINNPSLVDSTWTETSNYPQRGDIDVTSIQIGANYSFNYKKYSHKSSLYQLQRQKKSAGSFILGLRAAVNVTAADSSILPKSIVSKYRTDAQLTESSTTYFGVNFGYVHTFIIKKYYFIHFSLIPGINRQSGSSTIQLQNNSDSTITYRKLYGTHAETRIAIGYNNDKFYCGFWALANTFSENLEKGGTLNYSYNYVRFFVGYRFALKRRVPIIDAINL